jgi:hypothetical protein
MQKATIPAALFDELKRRADAAGGVGYGTCGVSGDALPSCIGDIAAQIDGYKNLVLAHDEFTNETRAPSVLALVQALGNGFGSKNDDAVGDINERKGASIDARVTFDELAAELGLVRGEA